MPNKKSIDYKLLGELLKNSRRSDRQLAKALGVSQPTVTRRRSNVEKELISGYTAIPRWEKLEYEIMAFTFVKTKQALGPEEQHRPDHQKATKWMMEQPNVIYAAGCRGLGWNGFMISVHKSYTDFDKFMEKHNATMGLCLDDVGTIIVSLDGRNTLKHLNFKYLAEEISKK